MHSQSITYQQTATRSLQLGGSLDQNHLFFLPNHDVGCTKYNPNCSPNCLCRTFRTPSAASRRREEEIERQILPEGYRRRDEEIDIGTESDMELVYEIPARDTPYSDEETDVEEDSVEERGNCRGKNHKGSR